MSELSKSYDPSEVENRWYPIWEQKGYFRAEATSTRPPFSMVLPPPNVTGSLHLGHALTVTVEDILSRWKRMSGYNVLWLPGTDHAGIATQMVVERELKKEGRTRHELGREMFLQKVWEWKEQYGARITEQIRVLGASLDWSREHFTLDADMSKTVVEVFCRLHEQGLIYRKERLINWDPVLQTAVSDLEVDHEERQGSLWHITYQVKDSDRTLVVATTRPETMLGDTAVAVHPEDERYADLVGKTVVLPLIGREIPIVGDPILVDPKFGTGVVKVTPAHDFNDYETGLRHNLPMISIFDERAIVNENGGKYQGLERFEARKQVVADLIEAGLLVKEEAHKVPLAISQRGGTPIEPRLSPQWFLKVEGMAKQAIEAVEQGRTRFVPESWTNVFYGWMRNIHDWCVSRQLWWGHQIPAWYDAATAPKLKDGSIDFTKATPVVSRDKPETPGDWVQDPDVLDTWFSSGLWPFSTMGWPNQTDDLRTFYPNAVMETGHDIIFFWVARMMMMGLHFLNDVPFRVVYLHAMVRDEKGEKMSKVKGNVIDPLDVIRGATPEQLQPAVRNKFPKGMEAFGADALRFTLASLTQQGRDIKLSLERVNGYKAFSNKLWNASRFALMNMGEFQAGAQFVKDRPLTLADRWILSRLNRVVGQVQTALNGYQFAEAASAIYQFVWREFCDWYIELAKGSLYGTDEQAKDTTRAVLAFCLDRIMRLLHPFMPFITEEIWQKLPIERETESICIAAYPENDRRLDDERAEAEMKPVIEVIEGIRTIRGESNLPPLTKVTAQVQSASEDVRTTIEKWASYIMPLAGLSALHVSAPGRKPSQAAADIRAEMEIYVPLAGVVDLAEERTRIGKEITRSEGELASLNKKLENPNFVAKAPPEVVEKDKARVGELTQRIAKLNENLQRLQPDAAVKIADPANDGAVNLAEELKTELAEVKGPTEPDPQVKDALDKLREGTKEGLSSRDRYDLGVAYLGMGLVDDAVREFTKAKEDDDDASDDPQPTLKGQAPKKKKVVALNKPAKPKKKVGDKSDWVKSAAKKGAASKPAKKKVGDKEPWAKTAKKKAATAAKAKPVAKKAAAVAKSKAAVKKKKVVLKKPVAKKKGR